MPRLKTFVNSFTWAQTQPNITLLHVTALVFYYAISVRKLKVSLQVDFGDLKGLLATPLVLLQVGFRTLDEIERILNKPVVSVDHALLVVLCVGILNEIAVVV